MSDNTQFDQLPLYERYSILGRDWADKESAASILENSKSAVMAQRQTALGDIPVNRAEQIVKASPDWQEYIERTVEARKEANLAKIKLEAMKMRFHDYINNEANARQEVRMVI